MNKHTLIALLPGLAGLVFICLSILGLASLEVPEDFGTTTGTITAYVSSPNIEIPTELNRGKYPLIEYEVDGSLYKKRYDYHDTLPENKQVTVRYDNADPAGKIFVPELVGRQKTTYYAVLTMGLIALVVTIGLLRKQRL